MRTDPDRVMTSPAPARDTQARGPSPALRPTLVFAVGYAVALWLHRAVPMRVAVEESTAVSVTGAALVIGGTLLFLWAIAVMAKAGTGIMFEQPATTLMGRGPYAWSRNPQYVAFASIYCGAALVMNTLWPFGLLPLVLLAVFVGVIAAEEQYLHATFGSAYDAYCRRVRRWM
jgi:protein-S-isoprenylcysteine O-methyltransferase Ste14